MKNQQIYARVDMHSWTAVCTLTENKKNNLEKTRTRKDKELKTQQDE